MGQQQLLLLVLSAIIVGISIVVGINMFSSNAYQANQEAVLQDVATIASKAQEWYRKPAILGGGERSFTGLNLTSIGFQSPNANGTYTLGSIAAGSFAINATGVEDGNGDGNPLTVTVNVFPDSVGNPTVSP